MILNVLTTSNIALGKVSIVVASLGSAVLGSSDTSVISPLLPGEEAVTLAIFTMLPVYAAACWIV